MQGKGGGAGLILTMPGCSNRDEELAALTAEVAELRRLDSTHSGGVSSRKLLLVLEQRAKGSKGIVSRAIRAHICRINFVDHMAAIGDHKLACLVQVSEALQKLVDEDDLQTQAPKSSALRLLLSVACKEAVTSGDSHNRARLLARFTGLMGRLRAQVSHFPYQWVDPQEEWVVLPGTKHAVKAEKVEGESHEERLGHRWVAIKRLYEFANNVMEDGSTAKGRAALSEQVGGWFGDS